jgi:hypothetical protein
MSTNNRRHRQTSHANAHAAAGHAETPALARQNISEEERCRLTQVRAYELWEQAGKPDGHAAREQFWCEAEKEMAASHAKNE